MTPSRQWLDHEEQIRRAQPFVFVVNALNLPWRWRLRSTDISVQSDQFFIKADSWVSGIIRFFVEIQHIFHRCHKLSPSLWDTPLLVLPGFEFIFF